MSTELPVEYTHVPELIRARILAKINAPLTALGFVVPPCCAAEDLATRLVEVRLRRALYSVPTGYVGEEEIADIEKALDAVFPGTRMVASGSSRNFGTVDFLIPFHTKNAQFEWRLELFVEPEELFRKPTPAPWPLEGEPVATARGFIERVGGDHSGERLVKITESDYHHAAKCVNACGDLELPADFPEGGFYDLVLASRALLREVEDPDAPTRGPICEALHAILDKFPNANPLHRLKSLQAHRGTDEEPDPAE